MNNVSEQLLKAMDIIVEQKLTQLQYDKTIQAKIYSVVDVDTGEYKVKYNGNIFSAFSNDTSKTYKTNDAVYVSVPEGDFSGKKIITSLITADSLSSQQLTDLSNSITEVSPTFDILYGGQYEAGKEYGVVAGAPFEDSNSYSYIYKGPDDYDPNGNHGLFQQYSNNGEYIRIKASFLTQFYDIHNKGNYGLEVEFYTREDNSVKYRLDLQSFNGNAYNFSVYSPQEIILKVQKNYLTGLKSIKLFEEDFNYDINNKGEENEKVITENFNIFVKDIILQYVDKKDLSDASYYLTITAPKGIAFIDGKVAELDLVGRLIYKGEDIMDNKKCACQWYKRNLNVMIGVDGYNKSAGFGWEKMENKTSNSLTLVAGDVIHQQKYKLVVIYNEKTTLSAEVEIWNRGTSYDYSIEQVTESANIKLRLRNNFNDESLVGDWYLSYPDGSYSSVQNGKKQSEIIIDSYLQYSSIVFYCAVYNAEEEIIGTLEYTITNSENEDDVTISYIGDDNFRYDANGDITFEDSEKERNLQVNLAWKEGFATSYSISWFMKRSDGKEYELPSDKNTAYNPDNSMLKNLWVDTYKILHYNIKQKYKTNFNNNIVIVKINTINGNTYSFNKEILCLKDGDQGTNGTTYIAAVRPCDVSGEKLSGLQPLRYKDNNWSNINLGCYVYKDGELINNKTSSYNITYKWQGFNVAIRSNEASETSSKQIVVSGVNPIAAESSSSELEFYVKVQVTIKEKNSNPINIYASYPIDVIIGDADSDKINIDSIPSYIKYNSSGLVPSFYSNNISFYYNNVSYSQNIESLNEKLITITKSGKEEDQRFYLEPASNFIFENVKNKNEESNIGVLRIDFEGNTLIHPIIMYLDTFGNEAINGWDGTALDTGKGGYVFAPQVGAGEKDSDNKFTGVVMGKDSSQDKIGLYGYQSGVNTFGLMDDGKAFFGAKSGGGQIVIDGTSAIISGGDTKVNSKGEIINLAKNGMYLRLANRDIKGATKAIGIGRLNDENKEEENFYVTYDGRLKANSATVNGAIYAETGQIGCSSERSEDGWFIKTHRLYSGNGLTRVEFNSNEAEAEKTDENGKLIKYLIEPMAIWAGRDNSSDAMQYSFAVSKKGDLYARSGNIGGWVLTANALMTNDNKIGLKNSGKFCFWAGANGFKDGDPTFINGDNNAYFHVDSSGKMTCRSAEIRGTIYADMGKIGSWSISGGNLSAGPTELSSNGTITTETFIIKGKDESDKSVNMGSIGTIYGSKDNKTTYNLGLSTAGLGSERSIILLSDASIRLSTSTGAIYLDGNTQINNTETSKKNSFTVGGKATIKGATYIEGDISITGSNSDSKLSCTISADNQTGIYARFA